MLSLIFTLAAITAPATPADGTYTYVSSVNGVTVGKTSITVTHATNGVTLAERGAGSYNGENGTIEDTLSLDSTLAPSSYNASANFGDRPMKATVTFKGSSATQTGDIGTKTYALAADAKHFVVLDLGPFSGWFVLPAQMTAWNNAPAIAISPAFGHGFPLVANAQSSSARPKNVPGTDASIAVAQPVPFTVWYDPKTLLVDEVDIPTQGIVVTRQS
jgi:hypothetical protein